MEHFRNYKIDFTNFFSGNKRTITLGKSKEQSREMVKDIRKRFAFWWIRSRIYC